MDTAVIIAIIIAVVVIVVIFVFRDRLSELTVDGSKAKMKAKMDVKAPDVPDEEPTGVVFKGNKIRGEGEYRMQKTEFSQNDVDGKQKIELGYDEPPSNVPDQKSP